jgi:hypothetical protein
VKLWFYCEYSKCFRQAIWLRCSDLFSEFVVLGVFSRFLPFRRIGIRHNGRTPIHWLARAPDTTYRLITTYPAQLQRTCIAHNNCKLQHSPARPRLPSILHTYIHRYIHMYIPDGSMAFDCKHAFCSPSVVEPVIPCETNPTLPLRRTPHHPTDPPSISKEYQKCRSVRRVWSGNSEWVWAREVKPCSNNQPYLFCSPAVVIVFEVSWYRHAGRQGMI